MPILYHFLTEWLQDGPVLPCCRLMWELGSASRKERLNNNMVWFQDGELGWMDLEHLSDF